MAIGTLVYQKATSYYGQSIRGKTTISYKIDGCRVLYKDGKFISRAKKKYPGLDKALTGMAKEKIAHYKDCEIYIESFKITNSYLQRNNPPEDVIKDHHIYPLDFNFTGDKPMDVDPRLVVGVVNNPKPTEVDKYLMEALSKRYEGIVLRTATNWYRVKPTKTADVRITGFFEQFDKHKNPKDVLGGFTTRYGRVTAFCNEDRVDMWVDPSIYIGKIMEVQFRELYDTGNFRYAVKFLRMRSDKDEESFDT